MMRIKPVNIDGFDKYEPITSYLDDLFTFVFTNGILILHSNYVDSISMKYINEEVSGRKVETGLFFEIDTSKLTSENTKFYRIKNIESPQMYQLVTEKPYKKVISVSEYEKLTASLKLNYKETTDKKVVSKSIEISEPVLDFAEYTNEKFDEQMRSDLDISFVKKAHINTVVGLDFVKSNKLYTYLLSVSQVMISAERVFDYILAVNDIKNNGWYNFGRRVPNDGEMCTISIDPNKHIVSFQYWDKPYHAEYEIVKSRKRNGGYYADGRTERHLVDQKPVSSFDYTAQTMCAKNANILVAMLKELNDLLTLKKEQNYA